MKRKILDESSYKSAEFIRDSSEEDTRDSAKESQPSPFKFVNGDLKSKSVRGESLGAEKVSDDESESGSTGSQSSGHRRSKANASDDESESNSSEEDDEDQDTGSDTSSEKSLPNRPGKQSVPTRTKKRGPPVKIAPKQFKAPEGFEPYDLVASDYDSQRLQMFSDLTGNQVWHISAPASLPLNLVQTLDIQAALKGDPILSHNGVNYNMSLAPVRDEVLLLPNGPTAFYSRSKVALSRNFQLREMVKPIKQNPNDTLMSNRLQMPRFSAEKPGQKKPPRQQPEGLKMRYVPYGVDGSMPFNKTSNDMAMEDQLHIPDILGDPEAIATTKKTQKNSKQPALSDEIEPEDVHEMKSPKPNRSVETPVKTLKSTDKTDATSTTKKRRKEKKTKLTNETLS